MSDIVSSNYPPGLPHDVALCRSQEELLELLAHFKLSPSEYDYISDLTEFRREVSEWRQRIQSEGYGFKLKMRAAAEAFLPDVIEMLRDTSIAPSVRTDLFKYVTKCAELEPVKSDHNGREQTKVVIEIANFSTPQTPSVISISPVAPLSQQSDDLP